MFVSANLLCNDNDPGIVLSTLHLRSYFTLKVFLHLRLINVERKDREVKSGTQSDIPLITGAGI